MKWKRMQHFKQNQQKLCIKEKKRNGDDYGGKLRVKRAKQGGKKVLERYTKRKMMQHFKQLKEIMHQGEETELG